MINVFDSTSLSKIRYTPEPDSAILPQEDETVVSGEELDPELLTLRSSTLTALNSFLDEQAAARDAMVSLAIESHPQRARDQHDFQLEEDAKLAAGSKQASTIQPPDLDVDKFKETFRENWQLSQFWYSKGIHLQYKLQWGNENISTDTAQRLAQAIKKLCPIGARVAFVCCPTGYVAFKECGPPTQEILLLEYDKRFAIVAGAGFVHYDLDQPTSFSDCDILRKSVDIVVVDPPFHSKISQMKISSTVAHILRPGGQLIILTGLTLGPLIGAIYPSPPLPRLHRRDILVEHDGVGRLETPYGCWVGSGTDGQDDSGFGKISHSTMESRWLAESSL